MAAGPEKLGPGHARSSACTTRERDPARPALCCVGGCLPYNTCLVLLQLQRHQTAWGRRRAERRLVKKADSQVHLGIEMLPL